MENLKGFKFNKAYGQNFLTDTNLLKAIAADSGATKQDTVLEIGAGAGALTRELCAVADRVVAYEIDLNLKSILTENLKDFDNVQLVFGDFLKIGGQIQYSKGYKVVANLPYYITTPIIFKLIENEPPESITIMVQKEVAERLAARADSSDYGALTAMVAFYGTAKITRTVRADMFTPRPKVDSCVVRIDRHGKFEGFDRRKVSRLVKAAFGMRRKTLANNLHAAYGISKTDAVEKLKSLNLPETVRGETLDIDTFTKLSELL